jgi:hypothetical protein
MLQLGIPREAVIRMIDDEDKFDSTAKESLKAKLFTSTHIPPPPPPPPTLQSPAISRAIPIPKSSKQIKKPAYYYPIFSTEELQSAKQKLRLTTVNV